MRFGRDQPVKRNDTPSGFSDGDMALLAEVIPALGLAICKFSPSRTLPVARFGGEILKFMGDGFLAIFPVPNPEHRPCAPCGSALDAAEQALASNRALNQRRRAADHQALVPGERYA
jgi:hypothetical protein